MTWLQRKKREKVVATKLTLCTVLQDKLFATEQQVKVLTQDQTNKKELVKNQIELCEKNKLLRATIQSLGLDIRKIKDQLKQERKHSKQIENDRILFLNFISELKNENTSLQVSI